MTIRAVLLFSLLATSGVSAQADSVSVTIELRAEDYLVEIMPRDHHGFRGDTVQFTATVLDTVSGEPMTDPTLVWSTDYPEAIDIDPATGLAVFRRTAPPGRYTVSARLVIDENPDPEPEPGPCLLFADGFESGDQFGAVGGQWSGTSNAFGSAGFSADTVYSGEWARRGTFMASADGVDSDVTFWATWDEPRNEIWFEVALRVPDNYEHRAQPSPTNNKLLIFGYSRATLHGGWSGEGWHTRLETDRGDVSNSQPYVGGQGMGFSLRQPFGSPWSFPVFRPEDRGQWIKLQAHVKLATSVEASDGVAEFYRDGQLIVGSNDLPLGVLAANSPPPGIAAAELLGWSNAGYDETTNFYIDDVRVWGCDPGFGTA